MSEPMIFLLIYVAGVVALQVLAALLDDAVGLALFAFIWPLGLVSLILASPFIVTKLIVAKLDTGGKHGD